MIKFTALIHKETGGVIKYEEWKEGLKLDMWFFFVSKIDSKQFSYKSKEMLFSDDFEIIYDSDFTSKELGIIFRGNQKSCDELMSKIYENMHDKEFNNFKYGIEV